MVEGKETGGTKAGEAPAAARCEFTLSRGWGPSVACPNKPKWERDDIYHQGHKVVACGLHKRANRGHHVWFMGRLRHYKDWHPLDPTGCRICAGPTKPTPGGQVCRAEKTCGWTEQADREADESQRREKAREKARAKLLPWDPKAMEETCQAVDDASGELRNAARSWIYDDDSGDMVKASYAKLKQAVEALGKIQGVA